MTPPDAEPPAGVEPLPVTASTRRERRVQTGALLVGDTGPTPAADPGMASAVATGLGTEIQPLDAAPADPRLEAPSSDEPAGSAASGAIDVPARTHDRKGKGAPRVALTWVDETAFAPTETPERELALATMTYPAAEPDLLSRRPRRSPLRPGVLVPIAAIAAIAGTYSATTLLWPLNAVEPTISAQQVDAVPAPPAAITWPAQGSGAVSVEGIDGVVASTADVDQIASITKVVTALLVLDEKPLALGEQGPEYRFTSNDRSIYQSFRARGESTLAVPVGGTLTEYQLLEGMLIGSAGNYADRLASDIWPTDAVYARAANAWLQEHGVPGITIVEPTGFDRRNTASAGALIALAQKALDNPVIAEIVAKTSVDLPGAGHVTNTNGLLADAGVVGVKTGSRDHWNLLAAKDVTVGQTPIRLYAAVLGQADDAGRVEATRALLAQVEAELQPEPSVPVGTTVGVVETVWGERVEIKTDADADVILWNGGSGAVSTSFDLGDSRSDRDVVGTLTVKGPLDSSTVDVRLTADITPPTALWRLLHPLTLFGLD